MLNGESSRNYSQSAAAKNGFVAWFPAVYNPSSAQCAQVVWAWLHLTSSCLLEKCCSMWWTSLVWTCESACTLFSYDIINFMLRVSNISWNHFPIWSDLLNTLFIKRLVQLVSRKFCKAFPTDLLKRKRRLVQFFITINFLLICFSFGSHLIGWFIQRQNE